MKAMKTRRVNVYDVFKYLSPYELPGSMEGKKLLIQGRDGLLRNIIERHGLRGFAEVDRDQYVLNAALIPRLVAQYIEMEMHDKQIYLDLVADNRIQIPDIENISPIESLLYKSNSRISVREFPAFTNMMAEYDFKFDGGSVYYNTNGYGVLFIKRIGNMQVFYRDFFDNWDNIMDVLIKAVLPYLLFTEGLRMNGQKVLALKRLIIERYIEATLPEGVKNLEFIIDDAYSDLIKLSNVGQMRALSFRIQDLEKARIPFRDNLNKACNEGFYTPFFSSYEYSSYMMLFSKLREELTNFIPIIKGKKKNNTDIKNYYIYDQKMKECNTLKIDQNAMDRKLIRFYIYNRQISSLINDIHPDVKLGLFNIMVHLMLTGSHDLYFEHSPLCECINLFVSQYYKRKPVLIKMIIKNGLDAIYHDFKEDGLLMFHQLETLFGFRNSHLILDEVKEDYLSWFNTDQEKYSKIQADFIHKWAQDFLEQRNYRGDRIIDIIRKNLSKYQSFNDVLGSHYLYMTSKGSVDDYKITTKKGKTRNISKNMYFNVFEDQEEYQSKLFQKSKPRRNKVIIKKEEFVKQRIVINSTLDTFVPLSKINKFISVVTSGTGIAYFSNTKQQKAEHYTRLQNYLLYNKYMKNKFLCLPLDYSSYDHTITMGFIEATIEEIGRACGYLDELQGLVKIFKDILSKETIYFEELGDDPVNNQSYRYGMLSGWKITSSVESIGNAIVSYGIAKEMGEILSDYETMGDDLILIFDKEGLTRDQQLEFLTKICDLYSNLGFKMNVNKNSVGYSFLEFLRVTFLPGLVQAYPARVLGSLSVVRPGRSDSTFGINEFQSVIRKISKRYGVTSQYLVIAKFISPMYKRSDIAKYGFKYLCNPYGFEIVHNDKIDFEILKRGGPESTPVYRKYMRILNNNYKDEILKVVNDEFLVRKISESVLKPLPYSRAKAAEWQIKLLKRIFEHMRKMTMVKDSMVLKMFRIPDYHLTILLKRIISGKTFPASLKLVAQVNANLRDMGIISGRDYLTNMRLLTYIKDKPDLMASLDDDKIKAAEGMVPAIIISRAKRMLQWWISHLLRWDVFELREKQFLKSILSGKVDPLVHKILGQILDEVASVVSPISGMPIAYRAD